MKNEVKTQTTRTRQDWPEKEKKSFLVLKRVKFLTCQPQIEGEGEIIVVNNSQNSFIFLLNYVIYFGILSILLLSMRRTREQKGKVLGLNR